MIGNLEQIPSPLLAVKASAPAPPPAASITLTTLAGNDYYFAANSSTGYIATYGTFSGTQIFPAITQISLANNNPTAKLWSCAGPVDSTAAGTLTEFYCGLGFGTDNPLGAAGNLTAIDFGAVTTLQEIACNDNSLSALDVTGQAGLLGLWCGGSNTFTNGNLKVSNLPLLNTFWFWNQMSLTSFAFVGLPALLSMTCDPGAFDQASIDNFFVTLDGNGLSNGGPADFSGGTNATPSAAGIAATISLSSKGWTGIGYNP